MNLLDLLPEDRARRERTRRINLETAALRRRLGDRATERPDVMYPW